MTEGLVRARNPRGEGRRLREEILAAARMLLEGGSAETVTLRSVARKVGVSAPSIYGHFGSRDEILHAIVEEAFDELEEALSSVSEREPVAQLYAICDAYLVFAEQRPQRYQLMFGGLWNAAAAQENAGQSLDLSTLGLGAMTLFTNALQRCDDIRTPDRTSAPDRAAMLWVSLHGLAELRRTAPLFPWPTNIKDELILRVARLG